jgi:ribose transport system ATP-binding protein
VRDNISLLALGRLSRGGFVDRSSEEKAVALEIDRLAVKTPSAETPTSSLSGGNQQKVLFARSLLAEPTVLLADEPTRGVDAGARIELYQVLRRIADEGKAVVVLSSDPLELQGLCDRVLVFSRGEIVRTLEGDEITEESITGAAITSVRSRADLAITALSRLRLRRFARGDYLPSLVLVALILALGGYTSSQNDRFLGDFNVISMLVPATALILISLGQLVVLLAAGIDLSVGPLAGLVAAILSYYAGAGQSGGDLAVGVLVVLGAGLAVGLANGMLIRVFRIAPVLATLATFIVIEGAMLFLRPQPGGFYRLGVTQTLKTSWGPIPAVFIAAGFLTLVVELLLRRTRWGLALRAVGSDETRAHRLGTRVNATLVGAYVLCSLLSAAGGIVFASQVGVGYGDAKASSPYTLYSITAVVLGGASIFGGRGSFLGAFFGAVLIEEVITAPNFLGSTAVIKDIPNTAVPYWFLGALVLVGAGFYSRARGIRSAALDT